MLMFLLGLTLGVVVVGGYVLLADIFAALKRGDLG